MRAAAWTIGLALAACGESPQATQPDNAATAAAAPLVADNPARAADAAADARRHGPEIVAFSGVGPGGKVIDLIPGAAYWTRLFALSVGPSGHVYGIWPKPYAAEAGTNVRDYGKLAATPAFANTSVSVQPVATLAVPDTVDVVFTSQNFHDYADRFMGSPGPAVFAKAAFEALKPGGTLIVIDHVAESGSGLRDTDTLHRIDPATVKQVAIAAGFVFDGELGVLANPADNHKKQVFDAAIRGKTDQFVYRFRKPAA